MFDTTGNEPMQVAFRSIYKTAAEFRAMADIQAASDGYESDAVKALIAHAEKAEDLSEEVRLQCPFKPDDDLNQYASRVSHGFGCKCATCGNDNF